MKMNLMTIPDVRELTAEVIIKGLGIFPALSIIITTQLSASYS